MLEYCAIYARVSTKRQEKEGLSLESQVEFLKKYASENNLYPLETFIESESASKDARREFDGMLAWMKKNDVHILLCEKNDRFHRNMKGEKIIEDNNLIVHLPKDGLIMSKDGVTASQKLHFRIDSALSAFKSDIISQEVKKAFQVKLDKGEFLATPPIGYVSIKKNREKGEPQRIVKSDASSKVKRILVDFSSGKYSLGQLLLIAKHIGLKSVNGNPFRVKEDIRRMIRNRFYYGEFKSKDDKIRKIKNLGYTPLITKEIWEKNQEILKKRGGIRTTNNGNHFFFNNLIKCAICGGAVYGEQFNYLQKYKTKKGIVEKRYKYPIKYHCAKNTYFVTEKGKFRIPSDKVDKSTLKTKEEVVIKEAGKTWTDIDGERYTDDLILKKGTKVEEWICDNTYLKEAEIESMLLEKLEYLKFNKEIWQAMKKELVTSESKKFLDYEIFCLRSEQRKNETKLDKLYNDFSKDIIDEKFLKSRMNQVQQRQEEIETELREKEEERKFLNNKIAKVIDIIDSLKDFKSKYKKSNKELRKKLLSLMTIEIFAISRKMNLKGKQIHIKDLQIVWNEEFNDLFELGIIEKAKEWDKYYSNKFRLFNREKNWDG